MPTVARVNRAKSHKGRRILESKEPKVHEDPKICVLSHGTHATASTTTFLKNICSLRGNDLTVKQTKKNTFIPFDDYSPFERLSLKHDAQFMLFGTRSKKRGHTFVVSRLFSNELLDMYELIILNTAPAKNVMATLGSKPIILFSGNSWDGKKEYSRLRSCLLDFFRGHDADNISLQGLQTVLNFVLSEDKIYLRTYNIIMKRSDSKIPFIELESCGPDADFSLGRVKFASEDTWKSAHKQPYQVKQRIPKNIELNPMKSKLGRIHLGKQDLSKIQMRKFKALKRIRESKPKATVKHPSVKRRNDTNELDNPSKKRMKMSI